MEPAQKNGTRPPAGGYYTSTGRKIIDFLTGLVWASAFYLFAVVIASYATAIAYKFVTAAGWLCLLILLWRFFSRRGRRFAVKGIILAIILGLIPLMMAAFMYLAMIHEPKPIPFDRQAWLAPGRARQARHAMLNDLLLKHRLVGMTRPEVEVLLGKPERPYTGRPWYQLGPQLGFGIDDIWLELRYKNDKVSGFSIAYD